jgi:phenylalanyl-tRNA synthetase beta chain
MKFSYQWLLALVDGARPDPMELGRRITMKTAEVDGVEAFAACLDQAAPARVVSAEPISGSHNQRVVVDAGGYGQRTVVCGAPNCRAGMTTVYVPCGAKVGALEIRKVAISGVESDGMLVSGHELGINRDHSGVLELQSAEFDLKPDWIIEVDNKSLTHRPDLWGHFGMAREVAAITGGTLVDPVRMDLLPDRNVAPLVQIEIEDYDLCPRYSALVFDNVTVGPSPLWLQYRLEAIGLNPINNIVDVTNYLMAELAQPMHAFDADKLDGRTIYARPARAGERIEALNQEIYQLGTSNIVIADAGGPIAIGGVIGGNDSAISDGTRRIVLESANFQASSVRKTSSALKLRTDASMRFEKAQDPENTTRALARAVELLAIVSPGIRIAGGLADAYRPKPAPDPIRLPLEWLDRKLGRQVAPSEVRSILESLEFGVREPEPGVFSVAVPSWRATKDIAIKDDLVEEIGRMVGYDSITPVAPLAPVAPALINEERRFHHRVREALTQQGFTEVYNYSFVTRAEAAAFGLDAAEHMTVANPIIAEQELMRRSLLPGIVRNLRHNAKHFESFRLFEIGQEILRQAEGLPQETSRLMAAVYTRETSGSQLFELKRLAECLAPGLRVRPGAALAHEHPARAASVLLDGAVAGRLFELHPSLLETGRAGVLELDLEILQNAARSANRHRPLRRFPVSAFDLSVVAGERDLAGDIEARLREAGGPNLLSVEFVRQYSGPPLPEGRKSVSYRVTVGSDEGTLSSEAVGAIRAALIDSLRKSGYELRL